MKKLLLIALLMLALVVTAVACTGDPATNETTAGTTAGETPTEAPETPTEAPEVPTEAPEVPTEAPDVPTEAPETQAPEVPTEAPETEPETEPVDPMAPASIFKAEEMTVTGPNQLASHELVDNYLHLVPSGTDPFFYPFSNVKGARYVVVRYRTADATGANMQVFIGSSGAGPVDDSTMVQVPLTVDGEWHLAVFDTQSIDAAKYDGSTVSYLRFDILEAGYILDENGEPQKDENNQWIKYPLPEGCSVDVEYIGFFHSIEAAELFDAAPTMIVEADALAEKANGGNQTNAELQEGFVRLTTKGGGDPYFQFISSAGVQPQYMAISYRTNSTTNGQFFIGSGGGPSGAGDNFEVDWADGKWKLMVIDLAATGVTSITDGNINYVRLDFFTGDGAEGDYFDVQYVGFFKSAAAAETYFEFKSFLPKDATNLFQSNAASNIGEDNADVDLKSSDLAGYFDIAYGANDPHSVAMQDGVAVYKIGGFNAASVLPNGKYAFSVKDMTIGTPGFSGLFVRALRNANIEKQFYGQDGNDAAGNSYSGAGIYVSLEGAASLRINVKSYVDGKYVPNIFKVDVPSNDITVADDGEKVYILSGDVTVAILTVQGTADYGIEGVAADESAATVTVALCDGQEHTVENAIVAAACNVANSIGLATRGGGLVVVSEISVKGFGDIEIPEMEIVLPPENIALGKPVTSTSVENETNIPSNATDGDEVSRFGALPNGTFDLIVDLEALYTLNGMKIVFENASWNYTVAVSADGENYTTVFEGTPHGATTKNLTLDNVTARYIKFTRLEDDGATNYWFSIYELYVFGEELSEMPA